MKKQHQQHKDLMMASTQTIRGSTRPLPMTGYESVTSPPPSDSEDEHVRVTAPVQVVLLTHVAGGAG